MIPTVAAKLAEGVTLFIVTLSKSASSIADSILVMISEVLISLSKYTPKIVDSIMTFLIGILDSVAENLPKLIVAAVKVIGAFFQGINRFVRRSRFYRSGKRTSWNWFIKCIDVGFIGNCKSHTGCYGWRFRHGCCDCRACVSLSISRCFRTDSRFELVD